MPEPIVTYTADVSICSQICRLAVQEHGLSQAENVDVDIEFAMDNYEPWFVRIQPRMTVPAMQYGDEIIGDSKDILYFLSDKHPEAGLYPEDGQVQIDAFINAFYENFMAIGVFTFGHLQARDENLRRFINIGKTDVTLAKLRALSEDPELADVANEKLKQVEQRDFTRLADPDLIARVDEQVTSLLELLEAHLADGGPWVAGSGYTLADIVATALLARVHFIKDESLFTPLVLEYWKRVQARPSFADANVCATWESTMMSRQFEEYMNRG